MDALRIALEEKIGKNFDFSTHADMLEELFKLFHHSIRLIPSAHMEPLDECNCVMYALGIRPNPSCSPLGRYYADTDYLASLIENGYMTELGKSMSDDALAIYFKAEKVQHIGISKLGRVTSKWGAGHIYDHAPLEVPLSFGDSVRYFGLIDAELAFDQFLRFNRR